MLFTFLFHISQFCDNHGLCFSQQDFNILPSSFTTFAISSLGILQTANADNLQMAVFANQITYLGASFTPLLMLMSFADLCRFRLNRILLLVLIILSMGIFACTSTVEISPVYYKNFWITEKYGITLFKKNYGFLHCFYYVYIISTTRSDQS